MLTHVYQIVRDRAERYPTAVALGGEAGLTWRTLTSRQLLDLVDQLTAQLAVLEIAEGDRVVLWAPNHWRLPVYLFALWKLGAIVVPFDREMNPEGAARIVDAVEPRRILVGYDERPAWTQRPNVVEWWEPRVDSASPAPESQWTQPAEELAAISFTSGTTGQPKGCMISHANLCSQVEAAFRVIPLDPSCRLASILPLSHLFELTCGMLYPLAAGAAIHYVPSRRGPDVVRVLSEQRITHMMVVPQLLSMMGSRLDDQLKAALPGPLYDALHTLASRLPMVWRRRLYWMAHRKLGGQLRMLASGGAALAPDVQRLWEGLGVRVVQGYGASECSPMIACARPDGSTPTGSVGRPIPGVEVRLSPVGELLVRGPNVMRGYWKDPVQTADVIQGGWYATGDLATLDAAGNIFLSGRAKELIVLPSGLKVWPQDVEDVLRAEHGVKDAVVVAATRPDGGAALHAYLVPAGTTARSSDLSMLVAHCNGRLAQHQRLASASWWAEPDFPRTPMLKIRRHLLPPPDRADVVQVESVLAADDPVGQAVAGVAHVRSVLPTQTLGELGLDSLGLVDLALALEEKTEKPVADGDLRLEMTVEQVRTMLASSTTTAGANGSLPAGDEPPEWPYTWGRAFRGLSLPIDLLYRATVTRTYVLGGDYLRALPPVVIMAGTHHGFADLPLVRFALSRTAARRLTQHLVVAAVAGGAGWRSPLSAYGVLAWGMYPLEVTRERETSLRGLVRLAQDGNAILIFPQGTHARPEQERAGDPQVRFRPGVAHLAAALDCPVVPFGVAGTERIMPPSVEAFHGTVIAGVPMSLKRGPLAIAFDRPLLVGHDEDPDVFAARLEAICYALTRRAEGILAHSASAR
jgi:long-chain acyl-CoA synthetase